MTVTAVYDANVLYPSLLRDLLIRIALEGAVTARWSEQILDEVFRNLTQNHPNLDLKNLARTRVLMNGAIRDVEVSGFAHWADRLNLPDPDDRHVLAAAIHTQADVIVTFNLKDFPTQALEPHGIIAQHPDTFLVDRFDADETLVAEAVRAIATASRYPPRTVAEIIARLDAANLPALAQRLHSHFHI